MYDEFIDEGTIPNELLSFLMVETNGNKLISKKYNLAIGTIMDLMDMPT